MQRVVVIEPPQPVLMLEEVKLHLKVDVDDDDALIAAFVAAATGHIDGPDGWLGRAIGVQTLEAGLDGFVYDPIRLPYPPLIELLGIRYEDVTGAWRDLDPATYELRDDEIGTAWPTDLTPYKVAFYLQAHVGGSESPLSRVRKTYGLSAPRWVARLTFRGGYAGAPLAMEQMGFGARLDGLIADLRGGEVKAVFHDFRRPVPTQPRMSTGAVTLGAAAKGATVLVIRGLAPGSIAASAGDYLGGDGRPHLVSIVETLRAGGIVVGAGSVMVAADGTAKVGINPPLSSAIPAGTPLPHRATGRFQLTSDDAGQNETEVGGITEYALDFVEDLA